VKNIIITSSNNKIEDFLVKDWLKSLKNNVPLKNTDIAVIDYGLSQKCKKKLLLNKVIIYEGIKNLHIVNKRFFDAADFLEKRKRYDQILFVDGGDVIFQEDISHLFLKNRNAFRVAPIGMEVLFFEWFLNYFGNFHGKTKKKIWNVVKNKPVINAGVIFAPVDKFISMCRVMEKMINNKSSFGPDQIVVNYFIYQSKYVFLDDKYNFMMSTTKDGFLVKNGIFYKKSGEKVAIVHNAGQMDFFRPIENFGYGPRKNRIKHIIYHAKKTHYQILEWYKKIFSEKNTT